MKEFTFAVLTYNQREYIIEHLESIRFQVEQYGQEYQTNILLCDDCSKDDTVVLAEKWIGEHRKLFHNVKVIVAEQNQGIVDNFKSTLRNISTKQFKLLAGDDLYYTNNVYEVACDTDSLVLTPTIRLFEYGVEPDPERWIYKEYLLTPIASLKKKVHKLLQYQMSLETPGVFYSQSLIDDGLFEALREYHWIEDIPLWNYLLSKVETKVCVLDKPMVIYRMSSGISQNKNHERVSVFDQEVNKIRAQIQTKYETRIYRYRRAIVKRIIKYALKNDARVKVFSENVAKAEREADAYARTIAKTATSWMEKNAL